jgi:hypothetical protein
MGGETEPKETAPLEEEKDNGKEEEKTKEKPSNPSKGGDEESGTTADETKDDETEKDVDTQTEIPPEIPPAPIFLGFELLPENEIEFVFSHPVSLLSLTFSPELRFETVGEGSRLKIKLAEESEPGLLIEADLLVKDVHGNTVNERLSFRAKNNRVPLMQINELRTVFSDPKAEFIEFRILEGGNLGTLRVFAAGNNEAPMIYEFKPVEVKKDEYVVLHLRTPEEGKCKDEYGTSLKESGGTDSSPTARDLWIPGSNTLLCKTDAVYVSDQDGKVLDAVMFSEKSSASWENERLARTADFLFSQGSWESPSGTACSPKDAVSSANTSLTRTISREESVQNTHTKDDWYIAPVYGATPGLPN